MSASAIMSGAWASSGGVFFIGGGGVAGVAHAGATSPNGYGSTHTGIMRWTNTANSSQIVWTDSATLGTFGTVGKAGLYQFSGSLQKGAAGFDRVAVNAAAVLSNVFLGAHIKAPSLISGNGDVRALSGSAILAVGDVVWVSAESSAAINTSAFLSRVQVDYMGAS